MTILFILPNFSGGGAERASLNIAIKLHQRGHIVKLIVFDRVGPLLKMMPENMNIESLRTKKLMKSIIPLTLKIYRLKPKVIFSSLSYINIFLIIVRFIIPRKFKIFAREANLPSISLPNNRYYYFMLLAYYCFYRFADRILCTSKKMKKEFIDNFNIPSVKVSILQNPIDESFIRDESILSIKAKDSEVFFVAAGRLVHQKGFDRLIRWFAMIENKKSKLYILGEGPLLDELKAITLKLEVYNRIVFLGFVDNPWAWYARADAFLLPSRWEGMSNAALESLATGTPVIATQESGGIAELSKDANLGAVIVSSSEKEFLSAMNSVKNNKELDLPRKSLLPGAYNINKVTKKIEKWLIF